MTLSESEYIRDKHDLDQITGEHAKVITVWSPSGGVGKTSIATGLALQLEHICEVVGEKRPVLIMSLAEYDDIPAHGIGYANALSKESESDGKNVLSLINVIGGKTSASWRDISDLIVANSNGVYYAPSLTQKELISANKIPDSGDYKRMLNAISSLFSFIIIDTSNIFYRDRGNLLNMAFNEADAICFVLTSDTRSMLRLFHFFDGIRNNDGQIPLDPKQCVLVLDKYAHDTKNAPDGQLHYRNVARSLSKLFAYMSVVPLVKPRMNGNLLDENDIEYIDAIADVTDTVLECMGTNEKARR